MQPRPCPEWHSAPVRPAPEGQARGETQAPSDINLGDQVRVPDDDPDEEPVVCDLCALLHSGSTQVQVHLVVGTGQGGHVKVSQPAELQLEGQGWLQVTVDAIFCKLRADRGEKTDRHTDTCGAGHRGGVPT